MRRTVVRILIAIVLVSAIPLVWSAFHGSAAQPLEGRADYIRVEKRAHTLTLFSGGKPLRTYHVALGRGGIGPKTQVGDNRVPEGTYLIVSRNAYSNFHRSLRIGYPTPEQARAAAQRGVDPGGDVMIHGIRNGLGWLGPLQRSVDWTRGCIALTDREMDQVWQAVRVGTTIEIRP